MTDTGTSSSGESVLQSILIDLSSGIHDFLVKHSHPTSLVLTRKKIHAKTRDFKTGDIVLPKGCVKLTESEGEELLYALRESCDTVMTKIFQDKHSQVAIHLDRPALMKDVLKEVNAKGSEYGQKETQCGGIVILRKSPVHIECEDVSDLRCSVLQHHLEKLLNSQGYTVIQCSSSSEAGDKVRKVCDDLRPKALKKVTSAQPPITVPAVAPGNKVDTLKEGDEALTSSDSIARENVIFDLQEIIKQKGLHRGNEGYDKNLDRAKVTDQGNASDTLLEAIQLEADIRLALEGEIGPCLGCLHLVPQSKSFKLQQALLVYQELSENPSKQGQISVGPVHIKGATAESDAAENLAREFHRIRFDQIKKASEMRLSHIKGKELDRTLSNMTSATINIDVLQNAAHVPLHLDMMCEDGVETRTGAFVMYNTARLKTLHANFEQQVQQGMYPQLPPVEEVNFSLLREEEEWELVFLYIARFPDLLSQAVEMVMPENGKLAARIHSHKLTNFLVSFSKCLSSYYSRYHILGEGESHLLPKMYARLHLMRAAHQVLLNGLELIGVRALDYL